MPDAMLGVALLSLLAVDLTPLMREHGWRRFSRVLLRMAPYWWLELVIVLGAAGRLIWTGLTRG